jgi:hypothetical protein
VGRRVIRVSWFFVPDLGRFYDKRCAIFTPLERESVFAVERGRGQFRSLQWSTREVKSQSTRIEFDDDDDDDETLAQVGEGMWDGYPTYD